ncbi:MAG: biopolymer transporter ExbD [Thermodesulfobacteriota bacterium]
MLKLPPRKRAAIAVPLTSLVDIVFLLLIYFLLASNFVTQEGIDVDLPRTTHFAEPSSSLLVVAVDRDGAFHYDGRTVDEEQLAALLRVEMSMGPFREVLVRADRQVPFDRVVQAMDIARGAGAKALHLAAERR